MARLYFFTPVALLLASVTLSCSGSDHKTAVGQSWTRLIEGSWTLDPGAEKQRFCVKKLITEDTYITAIRPVAPPGTHHTLLTLGDGTIDCTTAVANGVIYAAGIGSTGLTLPPGVAMKLPKGKYLNLGLHIYNTTAETLSGTSAMEVVTTKAEDVKYESEAVLAGTFNISIPPGGTTLGGDCSFQSDQTMFALFPHMHQLGTHLKTTFTIGGVEQVVHDADYDFKEQYQIPFNPLLQVHAGDKVNTECTYQNPTSKTVTFGESTDTEMCFSILFRYPAQGQGICAGGGGGGSIPGPACAQPGAPGNSLGIGKECTAGGGQCAGTSATTFCLNDYVSGDFGNFCTLICQTDADCGAGASCQGSAQKACIPTQCSLAPRDAGIVDANTPG